MTGWITIPFVIKNAQLIRYLNRGSKPWENSMRVYQKVNITVTDEHICAAFNELELGVETEVSATPRHDNSDDGQQWTEYEDDIVEYPLEINGKLWSKFEVLHQLNTPQILQLEQLLLDATDPDAWPDEEDGYDSDGY